MKAFRLFLPAFLLSISFLLASPVSASESGVPSRGLWITCIGDSNVLGSREGIEQAVRFAKQAGFKTLFVQVYRGDKAWFDSKTADASPFEKNRAAMKADPLKLMVELAHKEGIEVHAWLNTLTLSQNKDAKLLKERGDSVFTKDQHGRNALSPKTKKKSLLDRFYMREDQLFLEPGDPAVRQRVIGVVRELAGGYPELDGIHFDYIRYPASPPYLPGSKFNAIGLSYGYGEENVKRFQVATGVDPHAVEWKDDESRAWDDWKREQVTSLLKEAGGEARKLRPGIKISSAVLASFDRAYFAAYQDWSRWIEEGTVDFIVLMSYSNDSRYVQLVARNAIAMTGRADKVHVGLGAFLMAKKPEVLSRQLSETVSLKPAGLVIFDYDSLIKENGLRALFQPQAPAAAKEKAASAKPASA